MPGGGMNFDFTFRAPDGARRKDAGSPFRILVVSDFSGRGSRGERVLDQPLDRPLERPGPEGRVVALAGQQRPGGVGDLEIEPPPSSTGGMISM